jgi:PTS system D-glucosamine-specific IIC component
VGVVYFVVYYFLFKFLILKFNYKTPGREEEEQDVKLYTRADVNAAKAEKAGNVRNGKDEVSALIVKGLGGRDNISDVDCCATRLRITVHQSNQVKEDILKSSGAAGVIKKGNGVQVIYGPRVTVIKSNLEDYLTSGNQENMELNEQVAQKGTKGTKETNVSYKENIETMTGKDSIIYAPIEGKLVPLKNIGDGVFSEGMLGEGAAIEPSKGRAVSPVKGKIATVFETKHAIGITSEDGIELLIHIGLDTVELNGKYYTTHVKDGDEVKVGDLLVEFDMEEIIKSGYRLITPVIITNSSEFKIISTIGNEILNEKEAMIKLERE